MVYMYHFLSYQFKMARVDGVLIITYILGVVCQVILAANKPNILLVLTDDQDVALGGLIPMSKTHKWIYKHGITFKNAFSTTPICCPARSSLLTGLYQHNHHVVNNSKTGNCYGHEWQSTTEPLSLGPILHASGYITFYAGKYLNKYKGDKVPPGWDWWAGLNGNSVYYNYTININGTQRFFGDNPEDYLTDVLSGWTQDFLRMSHNQPFFMVVAPPAPHEPFTPSNKYKDRFKTLTAPRYPNFNNGRAGKHWLVRASSPLHKASVDAIDDAFRRRWETLLSVDDLMDLVMTSVPDNTYVLFTSDHGFHLGQFSLAWDKRQPYEEDIRVPLALWGPLVPAGATLPHPVLNIDIAPTLYELAGVQNPPPMDGKSFVSLLQQPPAKYSRRFRIEYRGEGGSGAPCYADRNVKLCHQELDCKCFDAKNNTFTCTRLLSNSRNKIICKFYDDEMFIERYDLITDPYQLDNLSLGAR